MKHRRFLLIPVGLLAIGAAWLWIARSAHRHPLNLLVITLDTMRADRLPAYGFASVATPALDRLAAEGLVFDRTFAAVPLTLPSHASLFTGLYPPRLGVRDNASPPLRADETTLAEVMQSRGFATAAFVASSVLMSGRGLEQGFSYYSDGESSACSSPARRNAAAIVDEALGWFQQHYKESFFAWIHLYDTHRPYRLPEAFEGLYGDPYLEAIAYEDSEIGRVIGFLEERALLENTLIVVVGDHGESLGDHGETSHGIFLYEEALHVPFILRGPGIPSGRVNAVTRLVDVMPTILDVFGESRPDLDGVSLMDLVRSPFSDPGLEVYAESLYPRRFAWAGLRALRSDRYKVIEAPRPELYDLHDDPAEQRDIFHERPAVAAAMLRELTRFDTRNAPSQTEAAAIDSNVAARLASLGYVGTGSIARPLTTNEPDPKDMIGFFNQMTARARPGRVQALQARCDGPSAVDNPPSRSRQE